MNYMMKVMKVRLDKTVQMHSEVGGGGGGGVGRINYIKVWESQREGKK